MKLLSLSVAGLFVAILPITWASTSDSVDSLQAGFIDPPAETRPMLRWWWFGPAVVKPQLAREMSLMKEGGFGGFEVQPTYPLALDGQYQGLKNLKFLSPEFYDMLGFTASEAKKLGLRMDLTLGSGWPYGGPMFPRQLAAQSIRDAGAVPVAPGQSAVTAPEPAGRGSFPDAPVIAALLGPTTDVEPGGSPYLALPITGRSARLPANLRGATQVRFFTYAPAELMQVKRAAYGAEGFIIDHYNHVAVEEFITAIAHPEVAACGDAPPYSVFCDSLEIVGEGWTPLFAAEFKRRRGYDLVPLLPALFDSAFPRAAEIRGDYGLTAAELFNDAFVDRFTEFARHHRTRFRLQAYGTPPTTLQTYARVDLDEGENYNWRAFSGTRWASSASHLLGRTVTSSEAFTWLHSPVFMAAPLDIKAESNLQFLNGVNQLLFHGWPYTAPGVEYPGWRFYAAAVFNEKNPWWIAMPDITRYLARTSHLLRLGRPANDIAVYLPEEDAFTEMTPRNLQMMGAGGNGLLNRLVNPVVPPIIDAGFNFDGIDAGMVVDRGTVTGSSLAFGDVGYRVVILPNVSRITLAAFRKLEAFANAGGILIAVGTPPAKVPGYLSSDANEQAVREISDRLFSGPEAKGLTVSRDQLAATLTHRLQPDVAYAVPQPNLGVVHRHAADFDLYFVANTSANPISTVAEFRAKRPGIEWWDANTGRITPAEVAGQSDTSTSVSIDLPPYAAGFLVFLDRKTPDESAGPDDTARRLPALDLSKDWDVSFRNAAPEPAPSALHLTKLMAWSDLPATRYFSGVATYTKSVDVPQPMLAAGLAQILDFGNGEPATVPGGKMGMRANFQPPIGDAAVIYVNGRRVGSLWCPPYRIDITGTLHAGANEIRVEVGNRAVNYMADIVHHPLPDYSALNANREFGGNRFQPQDMGDIQVLPSGLLGPVRLEALPPGY